LGHTHDDLKKKNRKIMCGQGNAETKRPPDYNGNEKWGKLEGPYERGRKEPTKKRSSARMKKLAAVLEGKRGMQKLELNRKDQKTENGG